MPRVKSEMLDTAQKYIEIVHDRGKRNLKLERVYRNIRKNPGLFLLVYNDIYSNKGATTKGADDKDTIQNMSLESVERIIKALESGTYQWKPARRVYIEKSNGKSRPLGIPTWQDKLLQGVIKLILNAYYEPRFSKHSHGFRPNRGCHTALAEIVKEWNGTTWFIEGDIKGCFDNINHEKLMEIIERDIEDERLAKLLRKMLEAGYMEDWKYYNTHSGTPQGGIISPILANIYMNELDKYVETVLMPKYNFGDSKKRTPNPEYQKTYAARKRAMRKGNREEAKAAYQKMRSLPSFVADDSYRRLKYVRYADDFILGFIGPKSEAEAIKTEIKSFLNTQLMLTLSEEKTLITHAKSKSAKFLGYEVHISHADTKQRNGRRSINGSPMLKAPQEVVRKWSNKFKEGKKTVSRNELKNLSEYDIVSTYSAEYNGIVNYYEMALNRGSFHQVKGHFTESLVKTLAEKGKTKPANIYQRHQKLSDDGLKCIEVVIEREGKKPLVASMGGQTLKYRRFAKHLHDDKQVKYFNRNQQSDRLLAEKCELCNKENVALQGHHVRKLSNIRNSKNKPAWAKRMIAINRKTLFVCKECHVSIHSGKYDGTKVK